MLTGLREDYKNTYKDKGSLNKAGGTVTEETISRRRLLKRSIGVAAGVGAAALVGGGFYNLLKVNDIRELIGDYPEGADEHALELVNKSALWPSN